MNIEIAPGALVQNQDDKKSSLRRWDIASKSYIVDDSVGDVTVHGGEIGVVIEKCPLSHNGAACVAWVVRFADGITNMTLGNYRVVLPRTNPMPLQPRRKLTLA